MQNNRKTLILKLDSEAVPNGPPSERVRVLVQESGYGPTSLPLDSTCLPAEGASFALTDATGLMVVWHGHVLADLELAAPAKQPPKGRALDTYWAVREDVPARTGGVDAHERWLYVKTTVGTWDSTSDARDRRLFRSRDEAMAALYGERVRRAQSNPKLVLVRVTRTSRTARKP